MPQIVGTQRIDVDLHESAQTVALENIMVRGDANAHTVILSVYDRDAEVDMTGAAVFVTGLLPGNVSVFTDGTVEGNEVHATLSEDFYSKKGTVYVLITAVRDGVQHTLVRCVYQVLKSALDGSIVESKAFPVSQLIEAAKNEEGRVEAEHIRAQFYEEFREISREARDVVEAYEVKATEGEEGYITLGTGVEYDARPHVVALESDVATLKTGNVARDAAIAEAHNLAERAYGTIDGLEVEVGMAVERADRVQAMLGSKLDKNQGTDNAGKFLAVDAVGAVVAVDAPSSKLDAHPVGSIYQSFVATSPATLFGGTWAELHGVFLYAEGEDERVSENQSKWADTYGDREHTHATSGHALTVDEMPSHTHGIESTYGRTNGTDNGYKYNQGTNPNDSFTGNTLAAGNGEAHTHGDTQPATAMPPHVRVYMWYRTA